MHDSRTDRSHSQGADPRRWDDPKPRQRETRQRDTLTALRGEWVALLADLDADEVMSMDEIEALTGPIDPEPEEDFEAMMQETPGASPVPRRGRWMAWTGEGFSERAR